MSCSNHPSAVLFEGIYDGLGIDGYAYAFKADCAAAKYRVIGRDVGGDGRIELRFPGPVRANNGCKVIGCSANSPHAVLVFKYSLTHH